MWPTQIAERYKYKNQSNVEPVVLVGHSYGADNIVRIAQRLKDKERQDRPFDYA